MKAFMADRYVRWLFLFFGCGVFFPTRIYLTMQTPAWGQQGPRCHPGRAPLQLNEASVAADSGTSVWDAPGSLLCWLPWPRVAQPPSDPPLDAQIPGSRCASTGSEPPWSQKESQDWFLQSLGLEQGAREVKDTEISYFSNSDLHPWSCLFFSQIYTWGPLWLWDRHFGKGGSGCGTHPSHALFPAPSSLSANNQCGFHGYSPGHLQRPRQQHSTGCNEQWGAGCLVTTILNISASSGLQTWSQRGKHDGWGFSRCPWTVRHSWTPPDGQGNQAQHCKCCTPLVSAVDIFKAIGLSMLDKQNGGKAITEESSSSDCY